jgi:hypothetical protein
MQNRHFQENQFFYVSCYGRTVLDGKVTLEIGRHLVTFMKSRMILIILYRTEYISLLTPISSLPF